MANHADLTGTELHENKGVAAATNHQVATANGSGATVWKKLTTNNLDTSSIFGVNDYILTTEIEDISSPGSIYIPIPYGTTVNEIFSAIDGAITTSDCVITFRNHSGGSMGTITVTQSGSAAGDVDNLSPVSNNTFTEGERMQIETDGASGGITKAHFVIKCTRTT